jgi:hypothetical protein
MTGRSMEAYRSDRLDRGQNETELVQPNDRGAAMTLKLLPIGLIITSLVSYQLSQRMMPTGANPFTIVAIVYFLGIFACALRCSSADWPGRNDGFRSNTAVENQTGH